MGLRDPPKPGVREAINEMNVAGVQVGTGIGIAVSSVVVAVVVVAVGGDGGGAAGCCCGASHGAYVCHRLPDLVESHDNNGVGGGGKPRTQERNGAPPLPPVRVLS